MGIRPRGQRELDRDQELEEAEEDPQEPARRVLGEHRSERRARHDPRRQAPDHRPADRAVAVMGEVMEVKTTVPSELPAAKCMHGSPEKPCWR